MPVARRKWRIGKTMPEHGPLSEALVLVSLQVAAHPLIAPLLEPLRLREFLGQAFPFPEPHIKLVAVDFRVARRDRSPPAMRTV